jgi:hypothetical protein
MSHTQILMEVARARAGLTLLAPLKPAMLTDFFASGVLAEKVVCLPLDERQVRAQPACSSGGPSLWLRTVLACTACQAGSRSPCCALRARDGNAPARWRARDSARAAPPVGAAAWLTPRAPRQACQDAHSQVVTYTSLSDFFANSFFAFLLVRPREGAALGRAPCALAGARYPRQMPSMRHGLAGPGNGLPVLGAPPARRSAAVDFIL